MSSNPMRGREIRRAILETLNFARGYALVDGSLRSQVSGLVRPEVSDDEWEAHVEWLASERKGTIKRVESDLDEELVQWAITERGRVMLEML